MLYSEYKRNKKEEKAIGMFPSVLMSDDAGEERVRYLKDVARWIVELGRDGSRIMVHGNEQAVQDIFRMGDFDYEVRREDILLDTLSEGRVIMRHTKKINNKFEIEVCKMTVTKRGKPKINWEKYLRDLVEGGGVSKSLEDYEHTCASESEVETEYHVHIPGNYLGVSYEQSMEEFPWNVYGFDEVGIDLFTLTQCLSNVDKTNGVIHWDELIGKILSITKYGKMNEFYAHVTGDIETAYVFGGKDFDIDKPQLKVMFNETTVAISAYVPKMEVVQKITALKTGKYEMAFEHRENSGDKTVSSRKKVVYGEDRPKKKIDMKEAFQLLSKEHGDLIDWKAIYKENKEFLECEELKAESLEVVIISDFREARKIIMKAKAEVAGYEMWEANNGKMVRTFMYLPGAEEIVYTVLCDEDGEMTVKSSNTEQEKNSVEEVEVQKEVKTNGLLCMSDVFSFLSEKHKGLCDWERTYSDNKVYLVQTKVEKVKLHVYGDYKDASKDMSNLVNGEETINISRETTNTMRIRIYKPGLAYARYEIVNDEEGKLSEKVVEMRPKKKDQKDGLDMKRVLEYLKRTCAGLADWTEIFWEGTNYCMQFDGGIKEVEVTIKNDIEWAKENIATFEERNETTDMRYDGHGKMKINIFDANVGHTKIFITEDNLR
jgi:hypothetical protein